MILVFGGTTEGRRAAEVLEEAGTPFYYSTKTGEQVVALHHGQRTDGAMDREAMIGFCREHAIRLIVDAAHPFATLLHQTIVQTAAALLIPAVRYERIYPPRDPSIEWIDDYGEVPTDIHTLLATTGVQSIGRLKYLEQQGVRVVYRILNRKSSILLAHKQGATDDQLCFYEDGTAIDVEADAILMKESGRSGGFNEKVTAAREKGMRIIVLKRPALAFDHNVDGPYGLRRMVERLLPGFFPLHSGLTTGTCATAAAIAATKRLLTGEMWPEVPVILPNGETISVPVGYADRYAYCIKESGDDPDVTNGLEIRAEAHPRSLTTKEKARPRITPKGEKGPQHLPKAGEWVTIEAGEGIGRFTLPGFDYPPGEPAINKGPREMIRHNLMAVADRVLLACHQRDARSFSLFTLPSSLIIKISAPGGAEIAHRTFNPRLGIEGGISIIGVSGIVKPFSEEAFIQSIRKCMEVAKASGSDRVVINSGAKSERFVKALYPTLPQQAFVEYGNYIGETLRMADELGFTKVTLGVMLGKAVKLAEGQLDTHSKKGTMNLAFIQQMLDEAHASCTLVNPSQRDDGPNKNAPLTLARELWERLPKEEASDFARVVVRHCLRHCQPLLPHGELTLLLIADDGTIHSLSPEHQPVL